MVWIFVIFLFFLLVNPYIAIAILLVALAAKLFLGGRK